MKTKTNKYGLMALIAIITLTIAIGSCKDDPPPPPTEQPKAQSDRVVTIATKSVTITTSDLFTDTEWESIVTTIPNKFNTRYNSGIDLQSGYESAFNHGITIIVEKTPSGYVKYKLPERTKLYINANKVNDLTNTGPANEPDTDKIALAIIGNTTTIDGVTP